MCKNREFGFKVSIENKEDTLGTCKVYMSKCLELSSKYGSCVTTSIKAHEGINAPVCLQVDCVDSEQYETVAKELENIFYDLVEYLEIVQHKFYFESNFNYKD